MKGARVHGALTNWLDRSKRESDEREREREI